MKLYWLFILFPLIGFAQESFVFNTNKNQTFNIRPGTDKFFHYIKMDKKDIVSNSLFVIDEQTQKLVIPENGYYEISASFYFNPSTSVIKYNRAGVNFGIVQINQNVETYVAATRMSFDQDNQDMFSKIEIHPTIVYLEKDSAIAPAISSGLLGNVLLGCQLGCPKKEKNCTSFSMNIKLISDQDGFQRYY